MNKSKIIVLLKRNLAVFLPTAILFIVEGALFCLTRSSASLSIQLPPILPLFIVIICTITIDSCLYRHIFSEVKRQDEQLWVKMRKTFSWWGTYRAITMIKQLPKEKGWAQTLVLSLKVWLISIICAWFFLPILLLFWMVVF